MMNIFRSSWFALLLLAGGSAAAFYGLSPNVNIIDQYEMQKYAPYAGWAIGAVAAVISGVGILLLSGILRLFKMPKKPFIQSFIILITVAPWLVFSWQLLGEPSFTPIARAVINFAARPLFWGALLATTWSVLMLITSFIPTKK